MHWLCTSYAPFLAFSRLPSLGLPPANAGPIHITARGPVFVLKGRMMVWFSCWKVRIMEMSRSFSRRAIFSALAADQQSMACARVDTHRVSSP